MGEVWRVRLADGASMVAKLGPPGGSLAVEGWMLDYLAEHGTLPVPEVLHAEDSLLLMSHIDAHDAITPDAESHAAALGVRWSHRHPAAAARPPTGLRRARTNDHRLVVKRSMLLHLLASVSPE